MAAPILFFFLALLAIAAALGMLISRNPVNSALWLVLNLFCVAGLYISLNATFIGVIQILVYAGAIMVLFLFVIMLLNLSSVPAAQDITWKHAVGFVLGMGVLSLLVYTVALSFDLVPADVTAAQAASTGSAGALGLELFTVYLLPFEIIGVLLLVATIGAVLIAKRTLV